MSGGARMSGGGQLGQARAEEYEGQPGGEASVTHSRAGQQRDNLVKWIYIHLGPFQEYYFNP